MRAGLPTPLLGLLGLGLLAGIGSSCNLDPVHKSAVDALGAEDSSLYPPESEYHRPGEPCALCHSDKGPAKTDFALGGTVFWGPDKYANRVDNAYVRVLDATKTTRCFVTNCNGNFYVSTADFAKITFPLLISVERTTTPGSGATETTKVIRRMSSHVGREASCATCHIQGLRDFGSPGQIRMYNTEDEVKTNGVTIAACPPGANQAVVAQCPEDRSQ